MAKESLVKVDGMARKAKCNTLIAANITPTTGIDLETFDSTIEDLNRIQEEIIWGE